MTSNPTNPSPFDGLEDIVLRYRKEFRSVSQGIGSGDLGAQRDWAEHLADLAAEVSSMAETLLSRYEPHLERVVADAAAGRADRDDADEIARYLRHLADQMAIGETLAARASALLGSAARADTPGQ
jgi:hypothetical protein